MVGSEEVNGRGKLSEESPVRRLQPLAHPCAITAMVDDRHQRSFGIKLQCPRLEREANWIQRTLMKIPCPKPTEKMDLLR